MILSSLRTIRVLSVDPTSKGFGFAVLEGPGQLIDWGVKHVRADGGRRNQDCLEKVAALIVRFQPDVFVVERTGVKGCLRRPRVRRLIKSLLTLARHHDLRVRRISRRTVLRCFSQTSAAKKYQVAVALARQFPELELHLPPERRLGDSEDERMSIFDALALGYASYESMRRARRVLSLPSPKTSLRNA